MTSVEVRHSDVASARLEKECTAVGDVVVELAPDGPFPRVLGVLGLTRAVGGEGFFTLAAGGS